MNASGVVRRFFFMLFDAVLPPRERTTRTRMRSVADIPILPTVHELLGVRIVAITDYRNAAVQDLVRALKYDGSGSAAVLAAAVLADYLREEIADARRFSSRDILLVPVPLHRSRRRERGFNQIELALKALPQEFRDGTLARLAPEVLIRARATKQQTRLRRAERIKNMNDAFEVPYPQRVQNSRIYLIDDVATTGATLKHAGKPLENAGAHVILLALARA